VSPWLIAGLGNPGARYASTRHNIGFMVVDALVRTCGASAMHEGPGGLYGLCTLGSHVLHLCKPMTYMNHSGEAVAAGLLELGEEAQLLVVHDDLDLGVGRLRFRKRGSHGGHRGIANIMDHLGHGDFARLKLGIGRPPGTPVTDFVLEPFTEQEWPVIRETLERAVRAIDYAVNYGLDAAMNRFNLPPPPSED